MSNIGTNYAQEKAVWIKSLKAGDEVLIVHHRRESIGKVAKVTPTGLVRLENGDMYNQDGSLRGASTWTHGSIRPLTPEYYEQMHKKDIADKLDKFVFGGLPLEKLQRIAAIIEEDEK